MLNQKSFIYKVAHYLVPRRSNNYRPQILHSESLLVLVVITAGFFSLIQTVRFFPSLQNSILGFATNISVEEVVISTNQQREQLGLKPLTLNSQLSAAALAKAQDMFDNQYWAHTSPEGKQPWDFIKAANYKYKVAGENLARDFYHTSDMVQAWMNSPTHKDNIVNAQYEQIGVAVVNGRLEGFETTLVVQMFGAPAIAQSTVSDSSAINTQSEEAVELSSLPETKQASIHNPITAVAGDEDLVQDIKLNDVTVTAKRTQDQNLIQSILQPIYQLEKSPLFSPLQLTKIAFLGVIFMIISVLVYDSLVIGNKKSMRVVGQNLGHITILMVTGFLIFLFKGGVIK